MVLRMPHPTALGNGVYHLNVRVPADVAHKVRGTLVTLPVDGRDVVVGIRDKVIVSLRTRDPRVAKDRFAQAHGALALHWRRVRAGPAPLTQKQAAGLAGLFYRQTVAAHEADPDLTPEALQAEEDAFRAEMDGMRLSQEVMHLPEPSDEEADRVVSALVAHRDGATGDMSEVSPDCWKANEFANPERSRTASDVVEGTVDSSTLLREVSEDELRTAALLFMPNGPAWIAFRDRADFEYGASSITYDTALDRLFGPEADRLCQRLGITVDVPSRVRLLREIGEAHRQAEAKLGRNMQGDWSPDPAANRFPAFEVPTPLVAVAASSRGNETVAELYARWAGKQAGSKSQSTIRRYGPALASLDAFAKGRDWRTLDSADVFTWATSRHEVDGVAPSTVNKNDLVAASSVLGWATTVNGKKMPAQNAAFGVRVQPEKNVVVRERFFRVAEISAILHLARSVTPDPRYLRASASRRWAPWLCACSGARVQEVLWLTKADVRQEAGVDVMCLPRTKDGHARMVPLHGALIDEGFLDFVRAAPDGWLFVGDRPPKQGASRTQQEMRAAELSAWVRSKVDLEKGVNPSHGWRHTWITYAEGVIAKRHSNRITGHNMEDVSGRYVGSLMPALAAEMAKFPKYDI